jgi:hypothetical protein
MEKPLLCSPTGLRLIAINLKLFTETTVSYFNNSVLMAFVSFAEYTAFRPR